VLGKQLTTVIEDPGSNFTDALANITDKGSAADEYCRRVLKKVLHPPDRSGHESVANESPYRQTNVSVPTNVTTIPSPAEESSP